MECRGTTLLASSLGNPKTEEFFFINTVISNQKHLDA
jgi:hypothetical protein